MPTVDKIEALRRDLAFRALQDAWIEGTAAYWRRREGDFWWVFTGDRKVEPTLEQLARRPDIAATITACRNRAAAADQSRAEFADVLVDVAHGGLGWE